MREFDLACFEAPDRCGWVPAPQAISTKAPRDAASSSPVMRRVAGSRDEHDPAGLDPATSYLHRRLRFPRQHSGILTPSADDDVAVVDHLVRGRARLRRDRASRIVTMSPLRSPRASTAGS